MNKMFLVSKREYLKTVKKPAFWLSTLLLPVLIIGVSVISSASTASLEDRLEGIAESTQDIIVFDESGFINQNLFPSYTYIKDKQQGIDTVINDGKSTFIYYPDTIADLQTSIEVYTQDQGLLGSENFTNLSEQILKQSVLSELGDIEKVQIINSPISKETTIFKAGVEQPDILQRIIVPRSFCCYLLHVGDVLEYILTTKRFRREREQND